MNYKTKQSAIDNLKRLFRHSPEADSITLHDTYIAYDRDLSKESTNKNWITNLMSHLKWHDLVAPVYVANHEGRRTLSGLQLTMEGKRALGRIGKDNQEAMVLPTKLVEISQEKDMDMSDVMKAIAKLKEKHPEFEISFDMKLKGV